MSGDTNPGTTPAQRALVVALEKLLAPIVYLFIHQRVPFQVFMDVAKRVFVRTAHDHFNLEGRTQTKSRVAMLTGITRADVTHILTDRAQTPELLRARRARVGAILEGWYYDPHFQDENGGPGPLPLKDQKASFTELVRRYGADLPPRTVLEELDRAGLVAYDDTARVYPLSQFYLPKSGAAPELIQCLGSAGYFLHASVLHNILDGESTGETPFFQRQVFSRAIPPHRLNELRTEVSNLLAQYYDETTELLEAEEEQPPQEGYHATAGVGLYYFEG